MSCTASYRFSHVEITAEFNAQPVNCDEDGLVFHSCFTELRGDILGFTEHGEEDSVGLIKARLIDLPRYGEFREKQDKKGIETMDFTTMMDSVDQTIYNLWFDLFHRENDHGLIIPSHWDLITGDETPSVTDKMFELEKVLLIDTLAIEQKYQGQGMGPQALESFLEATEHLAPDGHAVLYVSPLDFDEKHQLWLSSRSDDRIERFTRLERMYGSLGFYAVGDGTGERSDNLRTRPFGLSKDFRTQHADQIRAIYANCGVEN